MSQILRVGGSLAAHALEARGRDLGTDVPPRCVEDKSVDRLPEGRRVEEGEQDEAGSNEGETGGDTLGNLEIMKFFGTRCMRHGENELRLGFKLG